MNQSRLHGMSQEFFFQCSIEVVSATRTSLCRAWFPYLQPTKLPVTCRKYFGKMYACVVRDVNTLFVFCLFGICLAFSELAGARWWANQQNIAILYLLNDEQIRNCLGVDSHWPARAGISPKSSNSFRRDGFCDGMIPGSPWPPSFIGWFSRA